MYTARDLVRFWANVAVAAGGCAEWTAALDPNGYGEFYHDGRLKRAHRVAWEIASGVAVPEGQLVLHRCDNRRCVNWQHLFIGTHQDNMDDMAAKGRKAACRGVDNPRAKLAPEQVAAVKADPRPQRAIARDYGISKTQVGNIKRGEQWRP